MNHPYGDPGSWEEVPPVIVRAVTVALTSCGWSGARATEHTIIVPLDDRARGLPGAAHAGEHLYVVWGGAAAEWSWGTAHPDAPAGGPLTPLLAPPDDPVVITAQILRVLRTGRALP
ncbi:hypothetical protein ABZ543_08335 [Streptomyces roseifaciens]